MPYSGEVPITSFFPRVQSTVKRKGHESQDKRRRPSVTEKDDKGHARKKQRAQREQHIPPSGSRPSIHRSPVPKPPIKRTESIVSIGRASSITPPPVEDLARGEIAAGENVSKIHLSKGLGRAPASSPRCPSKTTSGAPSPRYTDLETTEHLDRLSVIIPSSQSQDGGYDRSCRAGEPTSFSSSLGLQSPLSPLTPLPSSPYPMNHIQQLEAFDDIPIVESSQSQPPLPVFFAPPGSRRHLGSMASINSTEEIIPSSQSQEMELEDYFAMKMGAQRMVDNPPLKPASHSPPAAPSQERMELASSFPQRTLSDALFPIPIRNINGRDQSEERPDSPQGDVPPIHPDAEDSVTEDESEDELPNHRTRPRNPETDAPLDATPASGSHQNTSSQSAYDADALPSVVAEFRDMFGDEDGSYPEDFPYSLR